jgi:hypothetical protein
MAAPRFVTSLAPAGRPGVQQHAVTSWLALGADVISLNTQAEITLLQDEFPQITFLPLSRTAQAEAGRPVPYLDDLLSACAPPTGSDQPAVLINADIVLAPRPQTLRRLLAAATNGTLICGARVDVDDPVSALHALAGGKPISGEIAGGFDYFVLPAPFLRTLTQSLSQSRLALGMPFWDYWLPLAALLAGTPTASVEVPFALHGRHTSDWQKSKFTFFRLFFDALLRQMTPPSPPRALGAPLQNAMMWHMLRFEHDSLCHALNSATPPSPQHEQAKTALADFYDRQFAVFVHHIRTLTPVLDLSS